MKILPMLKFFLVVLLLTMESISFANDSVKHTILEDSLFLYEVQFYDEIEKRGILKKTVVRHYRIDISSTKRSHLAIYDLPNSNFSREDIIVYLNQAFKKDIAVFIEEKKIPLNDFYFENYFELRGTLSFYLEVSLSKKESKKIQNVQIEIKPFGTKHITTI